MDILDRRAWPERALGGLDDPHSRGGRVLSPLSVLYEWGSMLHRWISPRRALPADPPSIGVGNLRVGGTGKTPVCAEIVRLLRSQGLSCALLSRGYRARGGGDEPDWLRRETGVPVILSAQRKAGFEEARQNRVDAVVLDDAFQSRDQARLRLCIVLARDLVDPPRVLPAGPARESFSGLSRAHALLIRRESGDGPVELAALPESASSLPRFIFRMRPRDLRDAGGSQVSLELLQDWGPGLLVSGLARPESLEGDALEAGAQLPLSVRFSDHARFGESEGRVIQTALRDTGAGWILTSEKNLPRLVALDPAVPVWALRSELEWEGPAPGEWLAQRLQQA